MLPESLIDDDVRTNLAGLGRVVLAVSGGVDSMVLLHAATRVMRGAEIVVATFDHGTGEAARMGVEFVRRTAAALGLQVESAHRGDAQMGGGKGGRSETTGVARDEASMRRDRWRFLHAVSDRANAPVVTAHTRDDQIETVAMRILRGTGVRGLAGLFAPSDVRRPLLGRTREEVLHYARNHHVEWREDPSNETRAYLRNRLRHDLLPALAAARPNFPNDLLDLSARAATLRRQFDALLSEIAELNEKKVRISRQTINDIPREARPFVWQALAWHAGVVLDRRGLARLCEETPSLRSGGRVPLSGGFELVGDDSSFTFRRAPRVETSQRDLASLSLSRVTRFGPWRFSPVTEASISLGDVDDESPSRREGSASAWRAWFPENVELALRSWQDGDRIATDSTTRERRRVKRFFSDMRVPSFEREGWPVVLLGDEIIWIPGIRRTNAATDRSGRPSGGVCIHCERLDE